MAKSITVPLETGLIESIARGSLDIWPMFKTVF